MLQKNNNQQIQSLSTLAEEIGVFLEKVPVLPQNYQRAQSLLEQAYVDFDELSKVLETDPGMVMRIIRVANSSYYGLNRTIRSIKDACIVLGQYSLRNILAASMMEKLVHQNIASEQSQLYLNHALQTAHIARTLSNITNGNRDTLFLAGLLHDIGGMFIRIVKPQQARYIDELMSSRQTQLTMTEREILGFDHAQLSAEISRKWNMPGDVCHLLEIHHEVESHSSDQHYTLFTADQIANYLENDKQQQTEDGIEKLIDTVPYDKHLIMECLEQLSKNSSEGLQDILVRGSHD